MTFCVVAAVDDYNGVAADNLRFRCRHQQQQQKIVKLEHYIPIVHSSLFYEYDDKVDGDNVLSLSSSATK